MKINSVINPKSNFLNFIFFLIMIFFFSISTKANEYEDYIKIGFQKEKLDLIYFDYLSVIDAIVNVEGIILDLEEGSINKEEAKVKGTKIIKETKELILEATNTLNNLEPLILSESLKNYENLYQEYTSYLKNEVGPAMNDEINVYENTFLNALMGEFEEPLIRYLNSLDRIIISILSENKLLGLENSILEDDNPQKSKVELYLSSNIYMIDFLEGMIYLFESSFASTDNAPSKDELVDFFSSLEISLADSVNNSEIALSKGLENLRLYKEDIISTEMTEQEIAWSNEVSLIFDETFEREQEIIKIMKIVAENFTLESISKNENALNDLLVNYTELEYYFALRKELAKKEANVLQKLQKINK